MGQESGLTMRAAVWTAIAMTIAPPATAQSTAGAAPAWEVKLDPPGTLPGDRGRACRSGTARSATKTEVFHYCVHASRGADLALTFYVPETKSSDYFSLADEPEIVVALLSDPRFSDFWPVIEYYGGKDGRDFVATSLRTRKDRARNAAAGLASRDTATSILDDKGRWAIAEANTLAKWGLMTEAFAILDKAKPEPDSKGRLSYKARYRLLSIEQRRGALARQAGQYSDAIAIYRALEDNPLIDDQLAINAKLNRAALLAEFGDPAEVFPLVEAAEGGFRAQLTKNMVEGSQRQFDWIRSCALHRLGRKGDAERIIAGTFGRPIPSRGIVFVPSDISIESRYRYCVADSGWFRTWLRGEITRPFSHTGVYVFFNAGPAREHRPDVFDMKQALRAEPEIARELSQFREAPDGWGDLLRPDRRAAIAREILAGMKN